MNFVELADGYDTEWFMWFKIKLKSIMTNIHIIPKD